MTNEEELIAQARRGLTEEAKRLQELVDTLEQLAPLRPRRYGKREQQLLDAKHNLNIVTTHLAEIDEWQKYVDDTNAKELADPHYFEKFPTIVMKSRYLSQMLVTKVKRLLGVK